MVPGGGGFFDHHNSRNDIFYICIYFSLTFFLFVTFSIAVVSDSALSIKILKIQVGATPTPRITQGARASNRSPLNTPLPVPVLPGGTSFLQEPPSVP